MSKILEIKSINVRDRNTGMQIIDWSTGNSAVKSIKESIKSNCIITFIKINRDLSLTKVRIEDKDLIIQTTYYQED